MMRGGDGRALRRSAAVRRRRRRSGALRPGASQRHRQARSLRSAFEAPLFRAFLAREKPILGICRGCQMINVLLGGTLYRDLTSQLGFVHSNGEIRHPLFAEEGSVLAQLFGREFRVNSTHHQAVKDLAPGLHVTGRSIEGIVEAFEHDTLPILATQFHPERLTGALWDDRTPDFAPYFRHFIEMVLQDLQRRQV